MSATKSASFYGLPELPESIEVLSIQLAIWASMTKKKQVIAMGKKIILPQSEDEPLRWVDGKTERKVTDLSLAAATLYECTLLNPTQMIAAQREMEARARAMADQASTLTEREAAELKLDAARRQLAEAEAALAQASQGEAEAALAQASQGEG